MAHIVYIVRHGDDLSHFFLGQLRYLVSKGFQVSAISTPPEDPSVLRSIGVRHYPLPMERAIAPLRELIHLQGICRLLRRIHPDIVHIHTTKAIFLGTAAAMFAGVRRIVVTVHGYYYRDKGWPANVLVQNIYKVPACFAHRWILINPADYRDSFEKRISPPHRTVYLPHGVGVDTDVFRPIEDPGEIQTRRRTLGLPSDDRWIGFIGRLMGFKGVPTFIELARRYRRMHRSGVFVVVWDRDFEPDVYEQVMDAAREGLIHTLEKRKDMHDIYPLFDVVVLPSTREGLPKTLMEAAASGIPALAYDIPGCRDVIRHGVTGLCVPKGDKEALLTSLSDLMKRPDVRVEMGRQAVRLARNFFDEKRVHELIGNLYANLLESVN